MTSLACLAKGFSLIFEKGTKRFSIAPLFINLILYMLIGLFLYGQFDRFIEWSVGSLPDWLSFLGPVLWLMFAIIAVVATGYTFAIIAMLICSPFHGLLAEKVAENLGYRKFDEALTMATIYRITKRALGREFTKLKYNLPRMLGVLLLAVFLGFIPILNLLAPIVTLVWAAWSMAAQFIDFPADNDEIDFKSMLVKMRRKRSECLIFGGATTLLLSIPLVNLLTISAAVAGATKLWLEEIE